MRRPRHRPLCLSPLHPWPCSTRLPPSIHLPVLIIVRHPPPLFALLPSCRHTHVGDEHPATHPRQPASTTRHTSVYAYVCTITKVSLSLLLPPWLPFWERVFAFLDPILLSSFLLRRSEKMFRSFCLSVRPSAPLTRPVQPRHRPGGVGGGLDHLSHPSLPHPADSSLTHRRNSLPESPPQRTD